MSQHFLLSAAARTLSLSSIFRMTDDEARDTFKRIRWAANEGVPFCPHCGCLNVYTLAETPPRWKCGGCRRKFSLTSQTPHPSRSCTALSPRQGSATHHRRARPCPCRCPGDRRCRRLQGRGWHDSKNFPQAMDGDATRSERTLATIRLTEN